MNHVEEKLNVESYINAFCFKIQVKANEFRDIV